MPAERFKASDAQQEPQVMMLVDIFKLKKRILAYRREIFLRKSLFFYNKRKPD